MELLKDLMALKRKELSRDKRASKTQLRAIVKRPERVEFDLGEARDTRANSVQYRRNRHNQMMHLSNTYKHSYIQRKWDKATKRELRAQYGQKFENRLCEDFVNGAR